VNLQISRVDPAEAAPFIQARIARRIEAGGFLAVENLIAGCQCFRVDGEAGLVGYYALSVIERPAGAEVVIVAGAGSLRAGDLTATLIPYIERQAVGARLLTVQTRRRGLLAKLHAAGWSFGGVIMHKAIA